MVRKVLKRAGFGFLLGIAIGNLIAALSGWPDAIVTDKLLTMAGSLCAAILWQTLLSGVLGAVSFAGVSLYDVESWPLLRVAVVHYLIIEAVYMPIAFFLGWIATGTEALIWMAFSAVTYFIIFLIMCAYYRAQVREINRLIQERKQRKKEIESGGAL